MQAFRELSIKRKLTLSSVATSVVVPVLASIVFAVREYDSEMLLESECKVVRDLGVIADEQTSAVPVIVVPVSSDRDSGQRAWGTHVIEYLREPIGVAALKKGLGNYRGADGG